jgi:hypothetical protein
MLIGLKRHLALPIRRPRPGALDANTPAAERDLAIPMAVTNRGPVQVPPALRTDDPLHLQLEQLVKHPESDLNRQRQQALLGRPHPLPHRLLHPLGEHGLIEGRLSDRYV